jgi:hypothetical protein
VQGLLNTVDGPRIRQKSALFRASSPAELNLVPLKSILYYPAIVRGGRDSKNL